MRWARTFEHPRPAPDEKPRNLIRTQMASGYLLLALAALIGLSSAAEARVVVVGDGAPAGCTSPAIQDALAVAEATPGRATIRFACGDQPITLRLEIPLDGRFVLPDRTTIDGGGRVTFDLGGHGPVFVARDKSATIRGLGLVGGGLYSAIVNQGTLVIRGSSISDNWWNGIQNYGGLTVTDTVFARNGCSLCGGAIFSSGPLTIDRSAFLDNGSIAGGGIQSLGPLAVSNSVFRRNYGDWIGGAIYHASADATIRNCEFTDNGSYSGGALGTIAGRVRIRNSTFARNRTGSGPGGGAISNGGDLTIDHSEFVENVVGYYGGAILNGGTLVIRTSIFARNQARVSGGAIWTLTQPVLRQTTFADNSPDDVYLETIA
jgi:hypothetical protein